MTATETASANDADLNQTARYRERSLSRITWLAATALASSAQASSANVTDPIVQRMASGGHSAGAGQSPVTSHGVATQWRPVAMVPAMSQMPTIDAAATGIRMYPSVRHCRARNASQAMDAVTGTAMAATAASAMSDPIATVRKQAP